MRLMKSVMKILVDFLGRGVQEAVKAVEGEIESCLKGRDVDDLVEMIA